MDILTTEADEAVLISRIRNGDSKAYKILYDTHTEPLFRFLKQFRKSDSTVQELVQRSFIKAYEGLATFNNRSTFRTWLFQIALNELRSYARRNSIIAFIDIDSDGIIEPVAPDEEERFIWDTTLRTLFDHLDETKRAVFILYEVEGFSHSEIAEILDIGESTSRTILTRTKRWLRDQLNKSTRNV